MSSRIGRMLSVEIFGESHGAAVGVTLDGLPAGLKLDMEKLNAFIQRRAARSAIATGRQEKDIPRVISGLWDDVTTGQPLTAIFENGDTHSSHYDFLPDRPRPGHADYPALMRSQFNDDLRGSGHHSGRLTLPYVFAGGVAMQLLEQQGIIYAVPGKGNFISPDTDTLRQQQAQTLKQEFADLTRRMKELGITLAEAQELLAQNFREEESTGGISCWPLA